MVVEVGVGSAPEMRLLGNPVTYADGGTEPGFRPPPLLGEHQAEVVRDWLGTRRPDA
jgi:crotonobetainyl-CoA:carnitine CoA-transferase CaiB-like acyl-CoA transferase